MPHPLPPGSERAQFDTGALAKSGGARLGGAGSGHPVCPSDVGDTAHAHATQGYSYHAPDPLSARPTASSSRQRVTAAGEAGARIAVLGSENQDSGNILPVIHGAGVKQEP